MRTINFFWVIIYSICCVFFVWVYWVLFPHVSIVLPISGIFSASFLIRLLFHAKVVVFIFLWISTVLLVWQCGYNDLDAVPAYLTLLISVWNFIELRKPARRQLVTWPHPDD